MKFDSLDETFNVAGEVVKATKEVGITKPEGDR